MVSITLYKHASPIVLSYANPQLSTRRPGAGGGGAEIEGLRRLIGGAAGGPRTGCAGRVGQEGGVQEGWVLHAVSAPQSSMQARARKERHDGYTCPHTCTQLSE